MRRRSRWRQDKNKDIRHADIAVPAWWNKTVLLKNQKSLRLCNHVYPDLEGLGVYSIVDGLVLAGHCGLINKWSEQRSLTQGRVHDHAEVQNIHSIRCARKSPAEAIVSVLNYGDAYLTISATVLELYADAHRDWGSIRLTMKIIIISLNNEWI